MQDRNSSNAILPRWHRESSGWHMEHFFEEWYQTLGEPRSVSQAQKDYILWRIQTATGSADITLQYLDNWLEHRKDKAFSGINNSLTIGQPLAPKKTGLSIMFPALTYAELEYLKILVDETPNPSFDIISMWSESPSLPNLTVDDAQRFVKYSLARLRHESGSIPGSDERPLSFKDVEAENSFISISGDARQRNRDMTDHTHLPTPTSTSPEPFRPPLIKRDPLEDDTSSLTLMQPELSQTGVSARQEENTEFLDGLAIALHERLKPMSSPEQFSNLLDSCREKTEKFFAALQRGDLVPLGLPPRMETNSLTGIMSNHSGDALCLSEPP